MQEREPNRKLRHPISLPSVSLLFREVTAGDAEGLARHLYVGPGSVLPPMEGTLLSERQEEHRSCRIRQIFAGAHRVPEDGVTLSLCLSSRPKFICTFSDHDHE